MKPHPPTLLGTALALLACGLPIGAQAQGTWHQTACLQAAGATGATGRGTCKAAPAWGQTGLEYVQSLAASAGPGNLGSSLVKPETLPVANAARAQLAAVMLGQLNGEQPTSAYRWFGPMAPATGAKAAGAAGSPSSGAPGKGLAALQNMWQTGALGDRPQTRSASWWLASPYLGMVAPVEVDSGTDRYRSLRFLAAQCPQLEGKVAPNAWTRCTAYTVP